NMLAFLMLSRFGICLLGPSPKCWLWFPEEEHDLMSEEMRKARFSAELQEEIAAYLATGDSHHTSRGVPGDRMQAMRLYDEQRRSALLAEVQRREAGSPDKVLPPTKVLDIWFA